MRFSLSPKTLVALSAFCVLVHGEAVTITERVCPTATIRTTTTTVQTTVYAYPSGWTDSTVNDGSPFVIQLAESSLTGYRKRDAEYSSAIYLLSNGNTTSEYSEAAHYQIVGGQLQLFDGTLISTDPGTALMPLAPSATIGSITKDFLCVNGSLNWANSAFGSGYAKFYQDPVNQPENARIWVQFSALTEYNTGWGLVGLVPQPVPSTSQPGNSLSGYTIRTSESTATPPWHSSAVPQSTSQGSFPTPGSVSPDGSCGHYNGFTCIGASSGTCCSAYGFCGTGDLYCGAGCQAGYGDCGGPDQASSSMSTSAPSETPESTQATTSMTQNISEIPTPTPGGSTPDGSCGGENGYTCMGAFSGSCCSSFGYCGSGSGYCDTGCQPEFGTCGNGGDNVSVTSSSSASPAASTPMSSIETVTSIQTSSSIPTPTPGGLTPDGSCGGDAGYTCIGAFSGSCCSGFGFCGSGTGYCDAGCQPAYGNCDTTASSYSSSSSPASSPASSSVTPLASSSVASSVASSASSLSSMSSTGTTSTTTTSTPTPTPGGLTPDGSCGGSAGYTCIGAFSGSCCSSFGFCGSGDGYCNAGCQPQYGLCNGSGSSSISSVSSSTSITNTNSVSTSSQASTSSHIVSTSTTSSTPSPQPTRCPMIGYGPNDDVDDGYGYISLPFNMTIFGYSTPNIYPSSNGVLTLDNGTTLYDAAPLPDTRFACPILEPWFDDLYIYASRKADATTTSPGSSPLYEGVYYTTTATDLNITYILSRVGTYESYIFSVLYSTKRPGLFSMVYTSTGGPGSGAADGGGTDDTSSNNGATAGIGVQRPNGDGTYDAIQWSYFQAGAVSAGYTVNCDTTASPPLCEGTDGRTVTGVLNYHA